MAAFAQFLFKPAKHLPYTSDPRHVIVLVGVPGSGKSYFSNGLIARSGGKWVRVNQDDMAAAASARPPRRARCVLAGI